MADADGTTAPPVPGVAASAALQERRAASARDLLEAALARIAAVDGAVRSVVHVAAEAARADADARDAERAAGRVRSPLHGIPFAVKDNYDVAGLPATCGSRAREGVVAEADADLVARLREAGAVVLGKLATWEYGTGNGGEFFDLPRPPARNPWDLSRFTGGSSTGAGAAVAAGMLPFALGSDTTGSVRLPAAATGTVGIIPTPGVLSTDGLLPNCYAMDVPGPFARTVEDVALVLDAIAGRDPAAADALSKAAATRSLEGVSVAVVADPGPGSPAPDPPLAAAFEAGLTVLESLGARLVPTELPFPAAECYALTRIIGPVESATIHEEELRERPDALGFALRDKLLAGSAVRAVDYLQALRQRTVVAEAMAALAARHDAILTFGTLHLAPRIGVEPEMTAFTAETMLTPFNLAGLPAMVQPNGFSDGGLPTHWQIAARRGGEAAIVALAAAFEAATDHRARRPALDAASRAPEPPPVAWPEQAAPADEATRAYAARAGLGRLSEADLSRLGMFIASQGTAGALPRPKDKRVRPLHRP